MCAGCRAVAGAAAWLPVLEDPVDGVMRSELPPRSFCRAVGTLPGLMGIAGDDCGHACDHYCKRRSTGHVSRELF